MMFDTCNQIEATRRESEQLFSEGVALGYPISMSILAVRILLNRRGIVQPEDLLAWVSLGQVKDSDIRNPRKIFG
ncbi:MAG: hypothetical protein IOD01_02950 [Rhodobacter sp.]|nr:hypothetical protein [Rhodobacter sp.]